MAQTITSPQIRCIEVLPNGSISLTWKVPPDPNNQFQSYQIYVSTTQSSGYLQQPAITTYSTNNTILTSVNANTHAYYVYMQTVTSSSFTLPAVDTLRSIYLAAVSGSSIAQLNWTGLASHLPSGESSSYDVWREYPVGIAWAKVASVSVNANGNINYTYNDTVSICDDTLNYRIQLVDPVLNCTSVSNIKGGHFQDKNKPSTPLIDSVSVINHQVVMGISPAYSQDVKCFIVHAYKNNTYTRLDSICNYNQPALYANSSLNPDSAAISISAVSQDSCAREWSVFPDNRQSTIYIHASYDFCNKRAIINWTPYNNMLTGVKSYEVFYSVNGGAPHHLGDTSATVFYQNNLAPGTTYCYYVRAHSNCKTIAGKDTASSTSNSFCVTTLNPPLPTVAYLNNVTINPEQTINVEWYVNSIDPIGGFIVYRSTSKRGTYAAIKNAAFTRGTGNYSFVDVNVNTNSTKYYYYVVVLDSACKNPAIQTDTSNSILLKAEPTANLTATLNWNDYAKYAGNVTGYNVYRSIDGVFGGPIAFVPSGSNIFVDDLSPYADKEGMFMYYVEAVEGAGNPYGFTERSWSNYDTVYIDANLYIPNAFAVHGENKVFLPIGAFIDNADYKLSIFNRWGTKIYETTDPNKGWDGTGHEEGVYAYLIQYKTSVGEYRQRKGAVTLIK